MKDYHINIFYSDEDEGYIADVPDLDACSAFGTTPDSATVPGPVIRVKVGDIDTERDFLESRSPLFKADEIRIPLLIAQGSNDPRVKQAEAEQIVAALRSKGKEVDYLLFEDEGHGIAARLAHQPVVAGAEAEVRR